MLVFSLMPLLLLLLTLLQHAEAFLPPASRSLSTTSATGGGRRLLKHAAPPTTAPRRRSAPRSAAAIGGGIGSTALNSAVGWMAATLLGGTLGTPIVTKATKSWYRRINLPSWLPPDRVFAPVWIALYCSMGYSASQIYRRSVGVGSVGGFAASLPLATALVHYCLNVVWAPVFFGLKRLRLGHVINVALVVSLVGVIGLFHGVHPPSAYLLLPYLGWLVFATALSSSVCALNPTEKGYNNAMLEAGIYELQQEAARKVGL